jgi:hypothetical protein
MKETLVYYDKGETNRQKEERNINIQTDRQMNHVQHCSQKQPTVFRSFSFAALKTDINTIKEEFKKKKTG